MGNSQLSGSLDVKVDHSTVANNGCLGTYGKYFILMQIALLTFLAFFGEGSINDWSVIYFTDELDTSPFVRYINVRTTTQVQYRSL